MNSKTSQMERIKFWLMTPRVYNRILELGRTSPAISERIDIDGVDMS